MSPATSQAHGSVPTFTAGLCLLWDGQPAPSPRREPLPTNQFLETCKEFTLQLEHYLLYSPRRGSFQRHRPKSKAPSITRQASPLCFYSPDRGAQGLHNQSSRL